MLSSPAFTPSPREQKERPGPDVGQRGGEPQSSDTTNNLDAEITRTQAPHIGQQEGGGKGTVGVGDVVGVLGAGVTSLGEGRVMFEASGRPR